MARLHEYQGKGILAANGFIIPHGRAASTADDAVAAGQRSFISGHETSAHHYFASLGVGEATSFLKRGSFRSGSNIGSSRSSAGVSSTFTSAPSYGIDSSFCKAAM